MNIGERYVLELLEDWLWMTKQEPLTAERKLLYAALCFFSEALDKHQRNGDRCDYCKRVWPCATVFDIGQILGDNQSGLVDFA